MSTLCGEAQTWAERSLAPSTQRLYAAACKRYTSFCQQLNLTPFPTSQRHLTAFAAHLAHSKSAATVTTYVAAVKHQHLTRGWAEDLISSPLLSLTLRGIRRHQTRHITRRPISYQVLENILHHLQHHYPANHHDRLMLMAAFSLAFHALLRVSEFTSPSIYTRNHHSTLRRKDVNICQHTLHLRIRASKTDQAGFGQSLIIGCSGKPSCPVSLIKLHLQQCHHPNSRPLFHFRNGKHLTPTSFSAILKESLQAAGENPRAYSTHSLRIGGATAAAAAGVEPALIQDLGRWRSTCYKRYTRVPNSRLRLIAHQMASPSNQLHVPSKGSKHKGARHSQSLATHRRVASLNLT